MHSLVSHMRSSSVSGKTSPLGAEGGGVVVQDSIVERTVAYLVAWSAVRVGVGGALDDSEGSRKGVFTIVGEGLLLVGGSSGLEALSSSGTRGVELVVSECGRVPLGVGEFAVCIVGNESLLPPLDLESLDKASNW